MLEETETIYMCVYGDMQAAEQQQQTANFTNNVFYDARETFVREILN
jgi:hypothetical protein